MKKNSIEIEFRAISVELSNVHAKLKPQNSINLIVFVYAKGFPNAAARLFYSRFLSIVQ